MSLVRENDAHRIQSEASERIMNWRSLDEFCKEFPNIPKKSIKWQLSTRNKNGLASHVQVIGNRLFINITGYASWLDSNTGAPSRTMKRGEK